MTDPSHIPAASDLDDQARQSNESAPGEAELDDAASAEAQDDTEDTDATNHRGTGWRQILMAIILALLALMTLSGIVTSLITAFNLPPRSSRTPVNPPVKAAGGPIDGAYRVDRYLGERTTRTPDGRVSAPTPGHRSVETEWWAFQSACPTPSCVAAGTRLDDSNHTMIAVETLEGQAQNLEMQSFRLVNGQWVSDPPSRVSRDCAADVSGHDMHLLTVELKQPSNGTLRGQESDEVESNECGAAGTEVTTPVIATRVGDLPSGLPPLNAQ